jgi:hypothetical protein
MTDNYKPVCGECIFFRDKERVLHPQGKTQDIPPHCVRYTNWNDTTAGAIGCGEGRFFKLQIFGRTNRYNLPRRLLQPFISFEQAVEFLYYGTFCGNEVELDPEEQTS